MIRPSLNTAALVALALATFIALPSGTKAALPLVAIAEMQDRAPEKARIEIVSVKRTEVEHKGDFAFNFRVTAKVVAVDRTATELKIGDEIEIRYSIPNFEKSPAAGDWPEAVVEGTNYLAFLHVRKVEKKLYDPAAASGSFEPADPAE